MNKLFKLLMKAMAVALIAGIFTACGDDDGNGSGRIVISPGPNAAAEAQTAFINATDGSTIEFEAGTFEFNTTLSMDVKNDITIIGAGRNETILDFSSQGSGADGMLITNTNNILVENLTVRDAGGDALKTRNCNTVTFRNVATIWSGEPDESNGAYGLYPVQCTRVTIDNCYAYGASDAGIYVGQTDMAIVKNTVAEGNVAGIEIENTTNADVFDNEVFDNTGGILVFDLPGLTQFGSNVRVFNNEVRDNNRTNFAPEGNIVANVPAGTGCMILSTENVEIFDNDFNENQFAGVLLASYLFVEEDPGDPNYNPFPSGIYIHDNTHSMTGTLNPEQPESIQPIVGLLMMLMLDQPNIFTDGIFLTGNALCIQDGTPTFVNLNAFADPTFQSVTTDLTPHDCTQEPLPEVVL